jgi:hypothetical protein
MCVLYHNFYCLFSSYLPWFLLRTQNDNCLYRPLILSRCRKFPQTISASSLSKHVRSVINWTPCIINSWIYLVTCHNRQRNYIYPKGRCLEAVKVCHLALTGRSQIFPHPSYLMIQSHCQYTGRIFGIWTGSTALPRSKRPAGRREAQSREPGPHTKYPPLYNLGSRPCIWSRSYVWLWQWSSEGELNFPLKSCWWIYLCQLRDPVFMYYILISSNLADNPFMSSVILVVRNLIYFCDLSLEVPPSWNLRNPVCAVSIDLFSFYSITHILLPKHKLYLSNSIV